MRRRAKKTQLERAREAVSSEDWHALGEVLDEAQNPPPDGGADGSISPAAWNLFAEVRRFGRGLHVSLARLAEAESEGSGS